MKKLILPVLGAILAAAGVGYAANLSYFQIVDSSTPAANMNAVVAAVNSGVTPNSMAMWGGVGRNLLDNGAMAVAQRGTAAAAGATTAGCVGGASPTYSADRWCVVTNVASGAGYSQVITASPAPPAGFQKSVMIYRNSGALLQPVEYIQEIETARVVPYQGRTLIASCYVQPLAGLSSASGAVAMNVVWGTGTDEGLGTWTASPAITPAFTGVTTIALTTGAGQLINGTAIATGTTTWNLGTTAAWNRIYSQPFVLPIAATEAAFDIQFTPVGAASGVTDGFAVTGCQIEDVPINSSAPSAFEMKPYQMELAQAQRFYYELDESATIFVAGACKAESVTLATCYVPFPVTMLKAPTLSYANGFATETTVGGGTLGACTTLATASTVASTAPNVQGILVGCTAATVPAAGSAGMLYSNNGIGKIRATADF